ncbi:dihydroorotate dehydrogenase, putative [Hepatocystis sp. ex Piliocolobus tephrosceles]|nr:dihydroorotate dehydrogenase, putative [Hepatocystis sp. ex Piliocolobus tephrosceles]
MSKALKQKIGLHAFFIFKDTNVINIQRGICSMNIFNESTKNGISKMYVRNFCAGVLNFGVQEKVSTGVSRGINKGISKGINKGISKGINKGISKGISIGVSTGVKENSSNRHKQFAQYPVVTNNIFGNKKEFLWYYNHLNVKTFSTSQGNVKTKEGGSKNVETDQDNSTNYFDEELKKFNEKIKKEKSNNRMVLCLIFVSMISLYMYFESYNPEFFLYDVFLNICLKYIDEEICHDLFMLLGKYNLLPYDTSNDSIYACSQIKHLNFINPFGVSAGFDKNGICIDSILKLGFSFIEIGTITPKAQEGNKRPRIFRDIESKSILNFCGFNNNGCDEVTENLKAFRMKQKTDKYLSKHIVGVSLGKNKNSESLINDLKYCIKKIGKYSDYITINVSSPNTPGLRSHQESTKLKDIILEVQKEINALSADIKQEKSKNASDDADTQYDDVWINTTKKKPLVFVKLAPDLEENEKKKIANILLETKIDGIIISNTTIKNMNIPKFDNKKGGISGNVLKDMSTQLISDMYLYTNKEIPIIASGGIFTGADALEKIEAGASVCQLYSCLVFNGMKTAVKIKRELNHMLYQKGYYNLKEAIGKKHKKGVA